MFELEKFSVPKGFRGRGLLYTQVWWLVQASLFSWSPQFMYRWRSSLLRAFGARVGRNCIIRPSVKITYPWKIELGDNVWLGDHAELYSLGEIKIGSNSVISQKCYLCTGSHEVNATFDIFALPISIGSGTWLATDVFVGPGVTVCNDVVVGARSSVFKDVSESGVYVGSPAKRIGDIGN